MKRHSPGRRLQKVQNSARQKHHAAEAILKMLQKHLSVLCSMNVWISRNISCLGLGYCNFNSCYHESWYIDNVSSQNHPQLGSNWDSSENRTHWGLTSKLSTVDSVQCHDAMALSKVDLDAHTAWPELDLFITVSVLLEFAKKADRLDVFELQKGLKEFCCFLPYIKHVGQSFLFCLFSSFVHFDSYQTFTSDGSNQFQDRVVMSLMNDSWILEAVQNVESRFGVQFRFFCILRQSRRILWRNQRWSCLLRRLILSGPQ